MDKTAQVRQLILGAHELMILDDAREHVIACDSGELWITQEGDRRDVILPAGRSWRIDRAGPVVLSAFVPSRAILTQARPARAAAVPRREGAAALLGLIRRWRHPALASFPARFIF